MILSLFVEFIVGIIQKILVCLHQILEIYFLILKLYQILLVVIIIIVQYNPANLAGPHCYMLRAVPTLLEIAISRVTIYCTILRYHVFMYKSFLFMVNILHLIGMGRVKHMCYIHVCYSYNEQRYIWVILYY